MRMFLIFMLLCVAASKQYKSGTDAEIMAALDMALEATVPELEGNVQKIAQGYGMVGKLVNEMANAKPENQEKPKLIMNQTNNTLNKEIVDQKSKKRKKSVDQIDENYSASYWPSTVKYMMDKVLYENKQESHQIVVNHLKDQLRQIITNDEFLILVYDDAKNSKVNAFANVENQHLCISEGGRCACVYRSLKYKVEDLVVLQNEMKSLFHDVWNENTVRHVLWKTADQIFDQMYGLTSLVALISHDYHVAYDATINITSGFLFGPGWILPATINRENIIGDWHPKTDVLFIAGLP